MLSSRMGCSYFAHALLALCFACHEHVNLQTMRKKERRRFLRRNMPLVWYDCACTLSRFLRAKKRRCRTNVSRSRSFKRLKLTIDKFHFRKGHSGCKKRGNRPLKRVWPQTHQRRFPKINDSAAKQSFAFLRKIAVAARRVTPVRGLLFVALVQHQRNLLLEQIHKEKAMESFRKSSEQLSHFHSLRPAVATFSLHPQDFS